MEADDIEMESLGRGEQEAIRQAQQDTADMDIFETEDDDSNGTIVPDDYIVPDVEDPVQKTTSFIDQGARPKTTLPPPLNDPRIREKTILIQTKVDNFYNSVIREKGYEPEGRYIDYTNFDVKDNKLFLRGRSGLVQLTQEKDPEKFYSLSTIEKKIGVSGVRELLRIDNYKRATRRELEMVENVQKEIPDNVDNILLDNMPVVANNVLQRLGETIKVFNEEGTQTTMRVSEMNEIEKAMTNVRDELVNNLSKLSHIKEEMKKEIVKLEQAKKDDDQYEIDEVSDRIRNYESERSARMEAIDENTKKLRSQFNRISETLRKITHEDKTTIERIKTLFREQGVTIATIITAIGLLIGVIVEAVLPGGTTGLMPTPKPPAGTGVKDWIKKQLGILGKLLAQLAGKAAAALPGIIGAIVSWLLSVTGKVVNWLANNLWALLVLTSGLLLIAAKKYIYTK